MFEVVRHFTADASMWRRWMAQIAVSVQCARLLCHKSTPGLRSASTLLAISWLDVVPFAKGGLIVAPIWSEQIANWEPRSQYRTIARFLNILVNKRSIGNASHFGRVWERMNNLTSRMTKPYKLCLARWNPFWTINQSPKSPTIQTISKPWHQITWYWDARVRLLLQEFSTSKTATPLDAENTSNTWRTSSGPGGWKNTSDCCRSDRNGCVQVETWLSVMWCYW